MCGRFALSKTLQELIEEFGITGTPLDSLLPKNWNIAPSKEIYIIIEGDGVKEINRANEVNELTDDESSIRNLSTASWGMIGHWYKDLATARASQSHAINARCETVFEKPTFKDSFRTRRCLIPADGYYEWATALGPHRPKQPFYISTVDGSSLPLAGIWSEWRTPTGEKIRSAAVITHEAEGVLAEVHSRMPVFMKPERWEAWLDPSNREIDELRALMEYSEPPSGLQVYAVSTAVNSVRNNGPELVAPITLGEPETLF